MENPNQVGACGPSGSESRGSLLTANRPLRHAPICSSRITSSTDGSVNWRHVNKVPVKNDLWGWSSPSPFLAIRFHFFILRLGLRFYPLRRWALQVFILRTMRYCMMVVSTNISTCTRTNGYAPYIEDTYLDFAYIYKYEQPRDQSL